MEVRIDQPWHDNAAMHVDDAARLITAFDAARGTNGDDLASIDSDRPVLDEANAIARHRQEMPTGDQRIEHVRLLSLDRLLPTSYQRYDFQPASTANRQDLKVQSTSSKPASRIHWSCVSMEL